MNNWRFFLYWVGKPVSGLIVSFFVMYSGSTYCKALTFAHGPYQLTEDKTVAIRIGDGVYERDHYPYAGAAIRITTSADFNPDHGDTWYISVDDKATGERLGTGKISYDSTIDCLLFNGSPYLCDIHVPPDSLEEKWFQTTVFYRLQCIETKDYIIVAEEQANTMNTWDIRPTRFKPDITYAGFYSSIRPKLPGDTYVGGNTLKPIQPTSTTAGIVVEDNLGCQKRLEDVEISVKNTISGAAGHAHFSGGQEAGTGKYTALNPDTDILDEEKSYSIPHSRGTETYTTISGITGKTNQHGVFLTEYTGGRFGVKEDVEIEAKRPLISAKDPESSDTDEVSVDIKVPGLVPLPSTGAHHSFVYGGSCEHSPTARWVSADMYPRIYMLAALYARDASTDYTHILSLNDASTPFGGLLDNQGGAGRNKRCHGSHRRGIDIDVNGVDRKIEKVTGTVSKGNNMYTNVLYINGHRKFKVDWLYSLAKAVHLEKVKEPSIHFRNKNHR